MTRSRFIISLFAGLMSVSLASVPAAFAQTTTGVTVSTSGVAAAACLKTCGAAAINTNAIQVTNWLAIENTNLVRPDIGMALYGGGAGFAWNPDSALKNTFIPAKTIRFTFHAIPGMVTNTTATSPRFGALGIGNLEYAASSDGKYVVVASAGGMYAPGVEGNARWGSVYNLGLLVNFGGQSSAASAHAFGAARRIFWGTRR